MNTCPNCKHEFHACESCSNKGWVVLRQYGATGAVDGAWGIERCDSCKTMTDSEARALADAIAELERMRAKS